MHIFTDDRRLFVILCAYSNRFFTTTHKTAGKNRNLPFAEFLERWTNDAPALHDTVSAHPDVSQVAPDDAVIHDNSLRNPERNTC